jgi:hypothetical protein
LNFEALKYLLYAEEGKRKLAVKPKMKVKKTGKAEKKLPRPFNEGQRREEGKAKADNEPRKP